MPVNSSRNEAAIPSADRSLFNTPLFRVPALLILFSWAGIREARHLTVLGDYDIWWHLRTGAWILQNHAVPHTALFTQYLDRPWIAYSWGFEAIAASFYNLFGLQGVPILQMCLKLALVVLAFFLARGSFKNFWPAVLLSAIGQYAITDFKARPGSMSILLLGIELILLFEIRRSGKIRSLYWLPLLFIVWANLHIQFVYGLFVLGLFAVVLLLEHLGHQSGMKWSSGQAPTLPLLPVAAVAAACFITALFTPYTYHLYEVAWQYAHSTATRDYIVEMHAMDFLWPQHYVRLLLVLAAGFALGYRRSWNMFAIALLVVSAIIAFRQQRDAWFVVLVSIAVIADACSPQKPDWRKLPRGLVLEAGITAALVVTLLVGVVIRYIPSSREALLLKVGKSFPVKACDVIRANHLSPNIFNPFNWGGFLVWYMPEYPVSIDGRTDLYGDDIVIRQYGVWDGSLPTTAEPTLIHARTLLVGRRTALAAALHESPGYRLVYDDEMAAVFERTVGPDIVAPK